MIYARLDAERSIYPEALQEALSYLENHDISKMEPGKHPIKGDKMFAVVVDVALADAEAVKPEAHRTYIDLQYWQDCSTKFGIAGLTDRSVLLEEHPENDVWYYQKPEDESFVTAQPHSFAVFFPTDIHRPDVRVDGPETIRKCVVKIDRTLLGI